MSAIKFWIFLYGFLGKFKFSEKIRNKASNLVHFRLQFSFEGIPVLKKFKKNFWLINIIFLPVLKRFSFGFFLTVSKILVYKSTQVRKTFF
jgi:hypothetical protein